MAQNDIPRSTPGESEEERKLTEKLNRKDNIGISSDLADPTDWAVGQASARLSNLRAKLDQIQGAKVTKGFITKPGEIRTMAENVDLTLLYISKLAEVLKVYGNCDHGEWGVPRAEKKRSDYTVLFLDQCYRRAKQAKGVEERAAIIAEANEECERYMPKIMAEQGDIGDWDEGASQYPAAVRILEYEKISKDQAMTDALTLIDKTAEKLNDKLMPSAIVQNDVELYGIAMDTLSAQRYVLGVYHGFQKTDFFQKVVKKDGATTEDYHLTREIVLATGALLTQLAKSPTQNERYKVLKESVSRGGGIGLRDFKNIG